MSDYSIADRAQAIKCPTLVYCAENDEIASSARMAFDALRCEKEFFLFRSRQGAGEHCEAGARLLFHQRVFDWLDARLQK